jgi:hypothetical protein
MIRYTLFALALIGTAATAVAAVEQGAGPRPLPDRNLTVIEKNQDFPVLGPISVQTCAVEDCSDTPSS